MPIQRLLRIALPLALGYTLFMALSPHPPQTFIDQFGDKVMHASAFVVLTLITRFAFPRIPAWLVFEHMVLFGGAIEVFQNIPSLHRSCDWRDWLADTLAITLALILSESTRKYWARPAR